MNSDIIFNSFGLFILGLVLLFGSYDILLRLIHSQQRRKTGLVISCIFLAVMGAVFLILSILMLAKLYASSKSLFFTGVVIFVAVAGGTFQLMKWKREIAREDWNMQTRQGDETPGMKGHPKER
ncbi:MAG: hypothetical protein AB1611_02520 [bacterium]